MDMLITLRENILKLFFASVLIGLGIAALSIYEPDPPGAKYASFMGMLGPWPYIAVIAIGVLLVLHTAYKHKD